MTNDLKPCPFCGSTDLKHYVTQATGGSMRGVVVCNACGCRLEYYTDYVHFIAEAYGGDWKSAKEYAHEDARIKVAQKWNRRAGSTCEQRRTRRTCRYARDHMGVAGNWFSRCSECGAEFDEMVVGRHFVFCPECGALVIGEETGDAD